MKKSCHCSQAPPLKGMDGHGRKRSTKFGKETVGGHQECGPSRHLSAKGRQKSISALMACFAEQKGRDIKRYKYVFGCQSIGGERRYVNDGLSC
ncbi:hypothetical protein CDAR_250281 [Caerostris darwini]|uniref:Uncharacterized protein n=1 Tax=Caerostris darwini TaxID=1538125 RepID=A0AAV4QH35_9ARAC|nr:hypothetical protein CDAR_250281 [Caerostris darwini]